MQLQLEPSLTGCGLTGRIDRIRNLGMSCPMAVSQGVEVNAVVGMKKKRGWDQAKTFRRTDLNESH